MSKITRVSLGVVLLVLFTSYTAIAQSLFQGPANGSIASGDSVSTNSFAPAPQPSVAQHVLEKNEHEVPLFPDPPNLMAPTGPEGSNVFMDKSSVSAAATAPTIVSDFIGIPDAGLVIPPDPQMAAGPNHLLACVNQEFRIFDKLGNELFQVAAASWFDNVLAGTSPCDPQVVYDDLSGRWIMIWIECGSLSPSLLLSVSDDSDPLGTWFNWRIPGDQNGSTFTGFFNDFPKLGVDQDAIYVTANMFDVFFQYVQLRIIPKAQLLNNDAGPVTWTDFWDLRDPGSLTTTVVTVVPSVDFGDAGVQDNTEYLINDSPFVTGTFMTLWKLVDPIGTQTLTAVDVPVVASSDPPDADQLGGGTPLIDVGGRRVRNAVYRDGSIWTAHSVAGGTGNAFANARYVRIDVNSQTTLEDVAFGLDGFWLFYPAIEVDNNLNMAMGYSRSSTSIFVEAAFTGRLDTDPPGLAASTQLKAGEDNYVKTFGGTRNRWGDYNGIALDPTNGNIWMFIEYAGTDVGGVNGDRWGTWFGEVNFGPVAPTITSTPNTTATVGVPYAYDADSTVEATGTPPITFSLVSGPASFSVASDGLVTWTPVAGQEGPQTVTIQADNSIGSDTQTFTVDVSAAGALAFRINAGGNDFTDSNGDLFVADKAFVAGDFGFSGGISVTFTGNVTGTTDDTLYLSIRGDNSATFSYIFDSLPAGDYDITLFFTEPKATAVGQRLFDVTVEGVLVLNDFDVFAASGGMLVAHTELISTTVSDGQLNIDFTTANNTFAMVSAIAVVSQTPLPDIAVSTDSLNFGDVVVGSFADQIVTVSNVGSADLDVSDLTTTNAVFTVVSPATPFTITAGGAPVDVTVRFSPTATGAQNGDLQITSNDPDEGVVTVALSGNGFLDEPDISVAPTSLDFGQIVVGDSADATVTISNVGTQTLTVSALATTNAVFSVVSPATPFDVLAGAAQDVTVRFKPTSVLADSGNLEITSNDPDEGLVTVALTGEGIAAPALVFRINAGGGNFTDSNGDLFEADKAFVAGDFGFVGGVTATFTGNVTGTTDDSLYLSLRGDKNATFSYIFDNLPVDTYDVTLFFTEPKATAAGQRLFDVTVEGVLVLNDFDVFAASGGTLVAHTELISTTVSDGQLNIDFTTANNTFAMVSAIAVVAQSGASPQLSKQSQIAKHYPGNEIATESPNKFRLLQNYPNPFNPETKIRYEIPEKMHVTLKIYNILGKKVRTLFDRDHEAGAFEAQWNGTNDVGNQVPSGVYVYKLEGQNVTVVKKMILLK